MTGSIRHRRREGVPRDALEHVLQFVWRWRSEIVAGWILSWLLVVVLFWPGVMS